MLSVKILWHMRKRLKLYKTLYKQMKKDSQKVLEDKTIFFETEVNGLKEYIVELEVKNKNLLDGLEKYYNEKIAENKKDYNKQLRKERKKLNDQKIDQDKREEQLNKREIKLNKDVIDLASAKYIYEEAAEKLRNGVVPATLEANNKVARLVKLKEVRGAKGLI